ncbi:MAG: hypothetical protein WC489_06210 [Patescibacteria group bacterium]|jgi:hypothetical protein
MAKWKETLKIDGKTFTKEGPYYCPMGTSWEILEKIVQHWREPGVLVRVKKYPIKKSDQKMLGDNTHLVFILAHKKKGR